MREPVAVRCVEVAPDYQVPVVALSNDQGVVTGEVLGLPGADATGTFPDILVGMFGAGLVASYYPGRVFIVDTSPASVVRSDRGIILGVRRVIQATPTKKR
jgi:hypothetical protein